MRSGELFRKKRCVERWSLAPSALIYCRPTLHEWIGSCKHFKLRRVRHYEASQPSVVKHKLVSKIYRITFIIKLSILNRSSPNVKKIYESSITAQNPSWILSSNKYASQKKARYHSQSQRLDLFHFLSRLYSVRYFHLLLKKKLSLFEEK